MTVPYKGGVERKERGSSPGILEMLRFRQVGFTNSNNMCFIRFGLQILCFIWIQSDTILHETIIPDVRETSSTLRSGWDAVYYMFAFSTSAVLNSSKCRQFLRKLWMSKLFQRKSSEIFWESVCCGKHCTDLVINIHTRNKAFDESMQIFLVVPDV